MNQPTCPYCGSTNINCEFVDIGVGEIQCTPYGCENCFAVQINPYDESARPDEEEKRIGWWKPTLTQDSQS
jgi:hypothetical protein